MRRRALRMTLLAVLLAVLILGVPMAIFGSTMLWNQEVANMRDQASSLTAIVDRRIDRGAEITPELVVGWGGDAGHPTNVTVFLPGGDRLRETGSYRVIHTDRRRTRRLRCCCTGPN